MREEPEYKKHESYGVICLSRVQGNREALFGSSISHNHFISLSIYHGEIKRDSHRDWIFPDHNAPIIEIEMSHSQFAEAITSFNQGAGTPVTIRRINGKKMADCNAVSKVKQFDEEFGERLENLTKNLHEGKEKISSLISKLPKKTQEEINREVRMIFQEMEKNLPFVKEQFTEQVEKTLVEAKAEIEAFLEGKARQVGIKNLQVSDVFKIEDKNNMREKQ